MRPHRYGHSPNVASHEVNDPAPRFELVSRRVDQSLKLAIAGELDASSGARQGLTYPLAPDLEGTASAHHGLLLRALPGMTWPQRRNWFQVTGVETVGRSRARSE